jgi:small-conductance mechanosensitive channel
MVFKRVAAESIASTSIPTSFANMKLSVTGQVFPILSQLFVLTPDKMATIVAALQNHVEWQDLLVILYFGWTTVPLAHLIHEFVLKSSNNGTKTKKNHQNFEDTWLYTVATLFAQAVRLALWVFLADVVAIALTALGFVHVTSTYDFGSITARLVYTIWIATKLARGKTTLLAQSVAAGASTTTTATTTTTTTTTAMSGENLLSSMDDKVAVLDMLLNVVVAVITLLFLADIFNVNLGRGGASICALGALQALVISMASKDLVQQFRKLSFHSMVDRPNT